MSISGIVQIQTIANHRLCNEGCVMKIYIFLDFIGIKGFDSLLTICIVQN